MTQWLGCCAHNHEVVSSISEPGLYIVFLNKALYFTLLPVHSAIEMGWWHHWCQALLVFAFSIGNVGGMEKSGWPSMSYCWSSIDNLAQTCVSEVNFLGAMPRSLRTEADLYLTFDLFYLYLSLIIVQARLLISNMGKIYLVEWKNITLLGNVWGLATGSASGCR